MTIAMILAGLSSVFFGLRAYTGKWQAWAHRTGYGHCAGFALLYFGGALVSIGILMTIPRGAVPTELLFLTGVPLMWCGTVGVFWLPKFLLPRWFTSARAEHRGIERALRDLKKTAKQQRQRKEKQ